MPASGWVTPRIRCEVLMTPIERVRGYERAVYGYEAPMYKYSLFQQMLWSPLVGA